MVKCLSQKELIYELTEKLPLLREAYDVSQTQLGELIGKSRQQISKIERGLTPLSWDTYLAIVMVTHNRSMESFDTVMGDDYFPQLRNFINQYENETA